MALHRTFFRESDVRHALADAITSLARGSTARLPRFVRPARSPTAANRGNRCRWVILQSGSGDRFGLIGEIPPKTIVCGRVQIALISRVDFTGQWRCSVIAICRQVLWLSSLYGGVLVVLCGVRVR